MVTFNLDSKVQSDRFKLEFDRLSALVMDMEAIRRGVHPSLLVKGIVPELDSWILTQRGIPCLAGMASGHPKLAETGRPIVTSDLWLLSQDRRWARTLSRWYELGRPARHAGNHS